MASSAKDKGGSGTPQALGLGEAYSVKTPEDNRRLYAEWAATYESAFVVGEKYRYPEAIAEVFAELVPLNAIEMVVDIGTGTGLTGTYLSSLRTESVIDGIDISPEMLAQASQKRRADGSLVYRELFERDLTKFVTTPNAPYDALICSGTFTHGHLGPDALDHILSLIRPGGWFVIGVNNEHFLGKGFKEKLHQLTNSEAISEPDIRLIDVYEEGSAHFGDQASVVIFTKNLTFVSRRHH